MDKRKAPLFSKGRVPEMLLFGRIEVWVEHEHPNVCTARGAHNGWEEYIHPEAVAAVEEPAVEPLAIDC